MQKKDILKDNKGITLITLVVTVIMMLIISSMIVYYSLDNFKIQNLNKMYNDIHLLDEQVLLYYSKNNELPILDIKYEDGINQDILGDYSLEDFKIIDIDKIDKNIKSNLNYGEDYYKSKYSGDDIYIINTVTHQIFYIKGIELDKVTYYTIPGENEYVKLSVDKTICNPPELENNMVSVIYNEVSKQVTEINQYDNNWYDYSKNLDLSDWARALGEDNEELYMWVPRYAYNTKTEEIVFLKGKTDEPIQSENSDLIDITDEEWIIPDVFQNREKEELTGIWLKLEDDYKKVNNTEDLIITVYELTGKDNTIGTSNTSIIDSDYSYYNPVIPVGFKTVPTKDASWRSTNGIQVDGWNDGLVIEDKDGNQFVWVPVDGVNVKYEKWCTNGIENSIGTDNNITLDEQVQITKYQGFYIGRYEAGTTLDYSSREKGTEIPLSKSLQIPWNHINYIDAKSRAQSMYSTKTQVKSDLLTGTMWDTIMKWLQNDGVDVIGDSTDWGNYIGAKIEKIIGGYSTDSGNNFGNQVSKPSGLGVILKTGASTYTMKKNIYDLAGNLWEWTADYTESDGSSHIYRGGCYANVGSEYQASKLYFYNDDVNNSGNGFRVALYVL